MVVTCAGALSTPVILERSGIGSQDLLLSLEIPMISHVPGVGSSYRDHSIMMVKYKANLADEDSLDPLWFKRR
jgi:choline dehydrogenase-like flavoprotein